MIGLQQGDPGRDGPVGEAGPAGKPGMPAAAPVFAAPFVPMGGGQKGYVGDEPEVAVANFEFYRMYDGTSNCESQLTLALPVSSPLTTCSSPLTTC